MLGGGSSSFTVTAFNLLVGQTYISFGGGHVSQFAKDHLRLPGPSTNGDFITYPQLSWGQISTASSGAGLLADNYATVYAGTGGVFFVGRGGIIGQRMQFTSAGSLLNYLPAGGTDGRLLGNYVNPTTTNAGGFGGEVAALKLNIDFADADLLGDFEVAFGDLVLHSLTGANQTQFNGQTVR